MFGSPKWLSNDLKKNTHSKHYHGDFVCSEISCPGVIRDKKQTTNQQFEMNSYPSELSLNVTFWGDPCLASQPDGTAFLLFPASTPCPPAWVSGLSVSLIIQELRMVHTFLDLPPP